MAAPGSVAYNADFTADTKQGQQSLRDYQAQIKAVRSEIAQATRDAKEQYQQQMLVARASGASQEELARIQQRYAQSLLAIKTTQKDLTDTILTGNYAALESEEALNVVRKQAVESINAQTIAIREYAAANDNAHKISNQSAASGAVQLFDGRGGIRTVENFLGNTLGLGGVFGMLFPVVGAIQSGKLLVDLGEKVYDVGEKSHEAGAKLEEAMEEAHNKSQLTVADLTIQADKLQDNIDKLSGHPGNGLKTALDEARKASLEFNASLIENRKQVVALFKEFTVGNVGGWLSEKTPTNSQEKSIAAQIQRMETESAKINADVDSRIAKAPSLTDRDTLEKERQRRQNGLIGGYIGEWQNERKGLVSDNLVADVDAKTGKVTYTQTDRNSGRIGDLDTVINSYQSGLDQYNARIHVADLTSQELALKGQKGSGSSSSSRVDAAKKQLEQWKQLQTQVREAQAESARLSAQYGKDSTGLVNDFDATTQRDQNAQLAVAARMTSDFVKSLSSLSSATINANRAAAEQAITQSLAEGKISAYDAAVQRQTLHTQQYAEALQQLQSSLANVSGNSLESNTRRNGIQQQIVELNARRSTEQVSDNAAVASQTVAGALKNANTKWLQDTQNLAPQIASVYTGVFQGINQQLTSLITGQKTSWASFFTGIAAQFANMGLNALEAPLMEKATTGGGITGVLKSLPFIGGLFGGFRANGGPVEAGKTYIVGEHGPEPVTFGSSGRMGTARDLSALGGGSQQHFYDIHVPAGITPTQFEQTMSQLIPQVRKQATQDAVRAMTEKGRRRPAVAAR